jgi:hypothetical protein
MASTRVLTTQRILVVTKLVLLSYIVLALVYPMDAVSSLLDSTAVKLVVLVAIIAIAQHDVGLSILLTLVLLTAIVRSKSPLVETQPPQVPVPMELFESDSESDDELVELPEAEKLNVTEAFEVAAVEEEPKVDLFNVTENDIVVMNETLDKLASVPEERLRLAQTNVFDPDSMEDDEEF